MNIHSHKDHIHLTPEDIQIALKNAIENVTGRKVSGHIDFYVNNQLKHREDISANWTLEDEA